MPSFSNIYCVFRKILSAKYLFPRQVDCDPFLKNFIAIILVADPKRRATIDQLLVHPFCDSTKGFEAIHQQHCCLLQ